MRPSFTFWAAFAHTMRASNAPNPRTGSPRRGAQIHGFEATLIARRIARSAMPKDRSASTIAVQQVVAFCWHAVRQRPHPAPIVADRLGRRAQLATESLETSCRNGCTLALSSPSVSRPSVDPVPVRGDLDLLARIPLTTGRRRGPPQHQRVAVPPAGNRGWRSTSTPWRRWPGTDTPTARATALRAGIAGFHDVPAGLVFAANGSNEVIQSLLLAYAGAGRTVVVFEPTYQLHSHIARITGATVVAGERRDDFTLDPDTRRRGARQPATPRSRSCVRRTTRQESSSRPRWSTSPWRQRAVSSSSTRPTPSSPRGPHSIGSPTMVDSSSCGRSRRRGAWRRHVSGTRSRRHGSSSSSTRSLCRTTSTPPSSSPATLAVRHVTDMHQRVSTLVEERGRITNGLAELSTAGVEAFASGANFILIRFHRHEARDVWQRLLDDGVLVRDCSGWPRLEGCLRVTVGLPGGERSLSRRSGGAAVAVPDRRSAAVKETA